jgi:hypothetical protein
MPAKKQTKSVPHKPVTKHTPAKTRSPAAKVSGTTASPINVLIKELSTLRTTIEKQVPIPPSNSSDEVDAVRRVLGDIMENRTTGYLQKLAAIRQSIPAQARDTLDRIDALMEEMGAITFDAERLEHLDPVIHTVGREVQDPKLPDGVIVETLHFGCRTARGQVLTKAIVSINRRA